MRRDVRLKDVRPHRPQHAFFGRYEHDLKRAGDGWRITRKKIILMNDFIPAMVDVFCV